MTSQIDSEQKTTSANADSRTFVIFVGDIQEKFTNSPVPASTILKEASAVPVEEFKLDALDGRRGGTVFSYSYNQEVDLEEKDRKFFRANHDGGGRS